MASVLDQVPADPWLRSTLLGLARHRHRQMWVAEILKTRLGADLNALATRGALGHPRHVRPVGAVPDLPSWTYSFHGRGCALDREETGENIDVDFFDDSGEDFNDWFYIAHLKSLRRPEPPEVRILQLHPSVSSVCVSIDALRERGLVVPRTPGEPPRRLHPDVIAHEDQLAAWAEVEDDTARIKRQRWLRARLETEEDSLTVTAYAELQPHDLDTFLDEVLAGPPSGKTSRAISWIIGRADPADEPRVRALVQRLDPRGPVPQPWLWERCTEWLQRVRPR